MDRLRRIQRTIVEWRAVVAGPSLHGGTSLRGALFATKQSMSRWIASSQKALLATTYLRATTDPQRRLFATIFTILSIFLPRAGFSAPYYGATFSYVEIAKEPEFLHGYQFLLNYDPQRFKWRQFNLYFDGGISHLWINTQPYYTALNIYTLSPVIRYEFKHDWSIHPYLEISIGLAYLNHTRLADRNFGMHPAFQDRAGIGFYVGSKQQFSIGIHTVHYSNAHLASYNSGITIPLEIDVGYRFS